MLHCFQVVVREAKNVVRDDVQALIADFPYDLPDVDVLKGALGHFLSHRLVTRLDAQGQPADSSLTEQFQKLLPHGVHAGVRPHPEFQPPVDDVLAQRLIVALVQKEHLVGNADGLHPVARQLFKLLGDEIRRPVTHVAGVGRYHAIGIVHPVDDVDHTEVTGEAAAQGGVDGGERGALFVAELRMPEVGPIQIERLFVIRQKIPSVAGQILVHTLLGNHGLGLVQNQLATALVPQTLHSVDFILEIGGQEIVEGVDPLVEEDEIHKGQRQHFPWKCAGVGTNKAGLDLWMGQLEGGAKTAGPDHVGRSGIRVLSVDHKDS